MKNISGIILAGGQGRRMGSDKGLTEFLGKPMIEHVLTAITPLCNQIIISANTQVYDYLGYTVLEDKYQDYGPSAGILEGLNASENNNNIIIPCDMPFVSTSFLKCLISFSMDSDITVPVFENTVQPLCGIYDRSITSLLVKLIEREEKRMSNILENFSCNYVDESNFTEYDLGTILQNFNSPAEIEEYLRDNEE